MLMKYRSSLNSRLIYGETINDSLHTFLRRKYSSQDRQIPKAEADYSTTITLVIS